MSYYTSSRVCVHQNLGDCSYGRAISCKSRNKESSSYTCNDFVNIRQDEEGRGALYIQTRCGRVHQDDKKYWICRATEGGTMRTRVISPLQDPGRGDVNRGRT